MSKHQIRGTGRSNLFREANFSGANGDRDKILFFPVELTTINSRIDNQTWLMPSSLNNVI